MFSMSGKFFSEKEILNSYSMILFSFPLDGCVDEVVSNQTNHQRCKYIYFLQYRTLTVSHFINGEGVY